MPQTVWNFRVGEDHISTTIAKINNSMGKMTQIALHAENALSRVANRGNEQFKQFFRTHANGIAQAVNQVPILSEVVGMLANPYTAATAAVAAMGVGLYKATQAAAGWDKKMAEANVTANLSTGELQAVSDKIMNIGRGSGQLQAAPDAFNRILSAGLTVNETLAALPPTLKAAKAGFTDLETVSSAVAGIYNASEVKDFTQIYDTLFATLNKGNAKFKDIADFLPKIIPGARAAGFELREVGGAFAYLTAKGFQADDAANRLSNVFKALSDKDIIYGTAQKKGLQRSGIQIFDEQGNTKQLLDIIQQIGDKMKSLSSDQQRINFMEGIGFDMEASAAINAMSQDTAQLNSIMGAVANSTGQFELAIKNSATATDNYAVFLDNLYYAKVKLGTYLLPLVNRAFGALNAVISQSMSFAQKLYTTLSKAVSPALQYLKNTINQNAETFQALRGVLSKLTPALELIGKVAAYVVTTAIQLQIQTVAALINTWLRFTNFALPTISAGLDRLNIVLSAANGVIQEAASWVKWLGDMYNAYLLPIINALSNAFDTAAQRHQAFVNGIKNTVGSIKSFLGFDQLPNAFDTAAQQHQSFLGKIQSQYQQVKSYLGVGEQARFGHGAGAKTTTESSNTSNIATTIGNKMAATPPMPQMPAMSKITNINNLPNISSAQTTISKIIEITPKGLNFNAPKTEQFTSNTYSSDTANQNTINNTPPNIQATKNADKGNKTINVTQQLGGITIHVANATQEGIREFEQKLRQVLEAIARDTSTVY